MKLGVNTYIWGATFGPADFHLLPRIKASGFDGIEVPILDPVAFQADAVGRELDRIGLARTTVANVPGGSSLASSDAGAVQRRRTRGRVHQAARIWDPRSLPGDVHACRLPHWERRTARMEVGRGQLAAPRAVAEAAGIEIALEPLNRFETYFLNTAADAAQLCAEVGSPHVGILLDTFHANIEEKSIGAALRHAGPHLKHLHVCENDRGIPGSGHVAWPEFFRTVAELGYDRWMTIESFGFSLGELSTAAAVWRDLAPTPEDIAFEGVKFLRGHVGLAASRH